MLGLSVLFRALVVCRCYRAGDSVIRIISSRRANAVEERAYTARRIRPKEAIRERPLRLQQHEGHP